MNILFIHVFNNFLFLIIAVVTKKSILEAISTLRTNHDSFDLVLSDVDMCLISNLNFQRIVEDEFRIPMICKIISILTVFVCDCRTTVPSKKLLFIFNSDQFKNLSFFNNKNARFLI